MASLGLETHKQLQRSVSKIRHSPEEIVDTRASPLERFNILNWGKNAYRQHGMLADSALR